MTTASLTPDDLQQLVRSSRAQVARFAATPIDDIVAVLDRLGQAWQPGSAHWRHAQALARQHISFSEPMIDLSLAVIPQLLSARNLRARLKADFHEPAVLDRFVESRAFTGRQRAFPLGVLFHVSAGNVFLGAIDSLLMGFLTKNVSIVKLSSRNLAFPRFFADTLREVDTRGVLSDAFSLVHFPGGSGALEDVVKQQVDGIVAWGGEEMILSYKRDLPTTVKFIEYGPKISFQVVFGEALDRAGLDAAGARIARDVALWDQAACASPQNLFVEQGIDVPRLMAAIGRGFDALGLPRGQLSDDEHVEVLKEAARGAYDAVLHGSAELAGEGFYLHHDPQPGLRPSPLNRTLILKSFSSIDDLAVQVAPFARHLQSCGYLAGDAQRDRLLATLGSGGAMRFAPLGQMMQAPIGAPHDGRMGLLDLVRLVPDERDTTVLGHVNEALAQVPFYRRMTDGRPVAALSELPFITGRELAPHDAASLREYTRPDAAGGYVFSSGGTSGAPKFAFYGEAEFDEIAALLAAGFAAQGVRAGDVVANLFVAGNLWSSFLAVDRALAHLGARTLPIAGNADPDVALQYLQQFPARVAVGLPTQLVELARRARERGVRVELPVVLYAGEHLSLMARAFLAEAFGTRQFGSAGYASVDAGPIGYQCGHAEGGIHHLFADQVHLEIVEGEAVVTSLIRRDMPVLRLRTGDLVDPVDGPCGCGSPHPRIRLLGRADSQFNLWGCRLFLEDVERALADLGLDGALYQVVLRQDARALESMQVRIEAAAAPAADPRQVAENFHRHAKDLRITHPVSWLDGRFHVELLPPGGIPRVPRTGKVKLLVDER